MIAQVASWTASLPPRPVSELLPCGVVHYPSYVLNDSRNCRVAGSLAQSQVKGNINFPRVAAFSDDSFVHHHQGPKLGQISVRSIQRSLLGAARLDQLPNEQEVEWADISLDGSLRSKEGWT